MRDPCDLFARYVSISLSSGFNAGFGIQTEWPSHRRLSTEQIGSYRSGMPASAQASLRKDCSSVAFREPAQYGTWPGVRSERSRR